ncbi:MULTISPECIES: hypothetical protein [unclassified Psychrobacter]|uniref:hypothetical protein n=1 Tax=unclassified Psychrobacter TaxID=196806 RepID=UPI00071E7D44|nr:MULTISPECIES: hypothetical protein [unclassified Psychrobacter]OLF39065.1 hypothetical protein BTV98_01185 [Psychrobacter sp. Cmf 22.2]
MNQRTLSLKTCCYQYSLASVFLAIAVSVHAVPSVTNTDSVAMSTASNQNTSVQSTPNQPAPNQTLPASNTLAAQIQPSSQALSAANQQLLSRNAQLQRQVNDLQTQVNVLVYESKGQLFLYGAFTVLISLLVGIFISWLVFVRRERW